MSELRNEWLLVNWEEDLQKQIYNAHLVTSKESFFDWMAEVRRLNATLCGTDSHLDNVELQRCLESGLDDDLKSRAQLKCANDVKDLSKWVQWIRDIDSCRRSEHKHFLNDMEDHVGCILKKVNLGQHHTQQATPAASSSGTAKRNTLSSKYPPCLTDTE